MEYGEILDKSALSLMAISLIVMIVKFYRCSKINKREITLLKSEQAELRKQLPAK